MAVTIYLMKLILQKKKMRAIKTDGARHIFDPKYPSISIAKLLEFA